MANLQAPSTPARAPGARRVRRFRRLLLLGVVAVCLLIAVLSSQTATIKPFPDTTNGIHIGLAFDYWVNRGLPPGTHFRMGRNIDYVWGAAPPGTGASAEITSAHLDAYLPFDLDPTGRSLAWFQAHHPSWVVYRCDRLGDPASRPAYYPSGSARGTHVPLDFSNPAVRAFEAKVAADRLVRGYAGIAVDDFTFRNFESRCGVYRNGVWTPLGYPQYEHTNAKLIDDMLGWLRYLRSYLRRTRPGATITVNFSAVSSGAWVLRRILPYIGGVLDEGGFTNGGTGRLTGRAWLTEVNEAELLQSAGKAYIDVEYAPALSGEQSAQNEEIDWILSNYLLVKGARAYTYIQGLKYGYDDLPEYHIPIGFPVSSRYQWQGVQARRYSGGLVLVNPSDQSYTVTLGRTYHDMFGRARAAVVLPSATGVVLLNSNYVP